jgi:hypothetical protein
MGPASLGHFSPEVLGTPFDCQAIFLSPLAACRARPLDRIRAEASQTR